MSFTGASLADGQTASTVGAIYTAAAVVIVKSVVFFNTNATAQTLNVYVTRSGSTRRQLYRFTLNQYDSANALAGGEVLVLSSGDTLDADTTTATAVDYLVTGATSA